MNSAAANGADFIAANEITGTAMNELMSPGNNNEAKRVHLDSKQGQNPLSKVIHIRNIPSDVTEAEVIHLGIPFGRVTNVLVLKGKYQAFLEMEDQSSAVAMVNYFTNCAATWRERSVHVQFSTHLELKTDQTHSNAWASAKAALQDAQALSRAPEMSVGGGKYGGNSNHSSEAGSGSSNTILHVVIEHMVYPVTLDVIYQVFSRVGKVIKIVTFTKNNIFQVLIQFLDVITAQAAKLSLDGQNIYNGCCTLRINYSKQPNLNVKYNNDNSCDYTNPGLPTGDQVMNALQSGYNSSGHGILGSPGYSNLTEASLSGLAGFNLGAGLPFAQSGLRCASSASVGGSSGSGMGVNSQLQAAVSAAQSGSGTVLLVSNLNEDKTECDHLFILFGVYGDVQRVKILFNKKDTALVQMAEPQQALLAMTNLDKTKLWDKSIRVMPSKLTNVPLPKEGQLDAGLTKDYTTSNLHLF